MNEMVKDLIKFKDKYNSNTEDLDENFLTKIGKNMSNMTNIIEDIKNFKKTKEKDEYDFSYEENELYDILNKIELFGDIKKCSDFLFKWKPGKNYSLSCYNLIATKTSGGEGYNCNILGDIVLPKNKISKWKIKLRKYGLSSNNDWDILIGVGPADMNQNEPDLYLKTWTFLCGNSKISIPSGYYKDYVKKNSKLKEGDIVEVIMNTINGELSFVVNGQNYGVACKVPLNKDLSPFVLIYDQGESIELLN